MKQVPHAELYQVHPNRITEWKKQLFEHAADIRSDKFPLTHQCKLLDLSRFGVYQTPAPMSAKDIKFMRQIDEIHMAYPFYGSRKVRDELWARSFLLLRKLLIETCISNDSVLCLKYA